MITTLKILPHIKLSNEYVNVLENDNVPTLPISDMKILYLFQIK